MPEEIERKAEQGRSERAQGNGQGFSKRRQEYTLRMVKCTGGGCFNEQGSVCRECLVYTIGRETGVGDECEE